MCANSERFCYVLQFLRIVSFCKDLFVRKNIISLSPLVVDSHSITVGHGQYKVLSYSIWISGILLAMKWVVFSLMELSENSLMSQILNISLIIVLALGLGAFQANIIQFRIDQLNDASTTELMSFVACSFFTIILIRDCTNSY